VLPLLPLEPEVDVPELLQALPMPMLDNAMQTSTRPWPICGTDTPRESAFSTSLDL